MHGFESFIFGIRWQDIVDILINSYILFRLYVLFKGTTTFRALTVIAFLWFFQRITSALGLVITSWAIQGFTAAGAIIVIVVFRNEIRSVFQATDFKTVFWGGPENTADTPVEIIAESMFALAARKIGALMVITGKESVAETVQNGLDWRGVISREMVMTIFWKDNPVHDGAVLVSGNRIEKVGVILPLTRREDLPSYYGTRHRAAVGMAEQTDAMVILVSEERGEVLVAKRGKIEVMHHPRILENRLNDHLGRTQKGEPKEKGEKKKLAYAAILCLLFVTGIWFGIARGSNTLVSYEVPIEFINDDPDMEIVETSDTTVQLHLSGSSFLVKSLRPGQIRVRTDINRMGVGKNEIPITLKDVTLPPGIILNKITPPQVTVLLAKPTLRMVPVQVDWSGRLSDDLVMTSLTITPEAVPVTGKSHEVNRISTVYTQKTQLNDIRTSGRKRVSLVLDAPSLKLADANKTVVVEYHVEKRPSQPQP